MTTKTENRKQVWQPFPINWSTRKSVQELAKWTTQHNPGHKVVVNLLIIQASLIIIQICAIFNTAE